MKPSESTEPTPWETEVYARGRQINRWPYTQIVARVLRAAGDRDRRTIRVLELGCGTGNNLRFLAEEGFLASGIDASPTAVAEARGLLEANALHAEIELGDIGALPWPDAEFDVVLDRAVLVHNPRDRVRDILSEVERVLKPGGRLISVGFKSIRHPDLRFGRRVGDSTWTDFSEGKFRGLGAMTFCETRDIEALFDRFVLERLEKVTRTDACDELLDEEFIIEGFKP